LILYLFLLALVRPLHCSAQTLQDCVNNTAKQARSGAETKHTQLAADVSLRVLLKHVVMWSL
jgi:hypothetical protein